MAFSAPVPGLVIRFPVGDTRSIAYGQLPYALFEEIRQKFIAALKSHATSTIPRTE